MTRTHRLWDFEALFVRHREDAGGPRQALAVRALVDDELAAGVRVVVVPEHERVEPLLLVHEGDEVVVEGLAVAVVDGVVVAGFVASALVVVIPLVELDVDVRVGKDGGDTAEERGASDEVLGEMHLDGESGVKVVS